MVHGSIRNSLPAQLKSFLSFRSVALSREESASPIDPSNASAAILTLAKGIVGAFQNKTTSAGNAEVAREECRSFNRILLLTELQSEFPTLEHETLAADWAAATV